MNRIWTFAAACALALMTGCASTGTATSTSPAATVPVAAVAASAPPLHLPVASTKRVVLNMSGPPNVTQAKDWPAFQEEWRATFSDHAKEAGIAFEVQQGPARALGEPGTLLDVYVNDYRMVGIGARIWFGVMTGNAYIDARVRFTDLAGGQAFGDRDYNTSSSAWGGIFSKMTPQQVDAIAAQVFGEIKGR